MLLLMLLLLMMLLLESMNLMLLLLHRCHFVSKWSTPPDLPPSGTRMSRQQPLLLLLVVL
jgi:hypothetical protein